MIFAVVAAAIVVLMSAYLVHRTGMYQFWNWFSIFETSVLIYCGIIMLIASACLLWKKKIKPEVVFSGLALGLGLAFLLVITPLSPPDEQYHYSITYKIANLLMLNERPGLVYADYESLIPHYNTASGYIRILTEFGGRMPDDAVFSPYNQNAAYWVCYLPQVVGVLCGRLLNRNFITLFIFGRFINLLFYACCVYFAVKSIPRFKTLLGMIAIMPMALHQAASFSTDSFINGMSFIIIAYAFKMIWTTEIIPLHDIIVSTAIAILLAPAKVVYCSLFLLFFLIPWENFGSKSKKLKMLCVMFVLAAAFAMVIQFSSILSITHNPDSLLNWEGQENYNLDFVFAHPLQTLVIFWNSFVFWCKTWLLQAVGSTLCGLNLFVNIYVIMAYFATIMLCAYESSSNGIKIDTRIRALCLVIVACVILLTMASMFLGWTSNTRTIILGVQGRYFIPVFPLLILPLSIRKVRIPEKLMNLSIIFASGLNVLIIAELLRETLLSMIAH